jgi:hypothetical protein
MTGLAIPIKPNPATDLNVRDRLNGSDGVVAVS